MEEKYCPTCGREIKTEFRTRYEIVDNINNLLKTNVIIGGKKKDLIKLEKAVKTLKETIKNHERGANKTGGASS